MLSENMLITTLQDGLASVFSSEAVNNHHDVAYMVPPNTPAVGPNIFHLSSERMKESDNYLLRANKSIHRSWPTGDKLLDDQLRRDSFIVRWCEKVYLIGVFTSDASLLKIAGDIAWPAQIYVDRFLYDQEPMKLCELYMFDLKSENWFMWSTKWTRINDVPRPSRIYAAIGSERLSRAAKIAIDSLWE